jgi:Putative lumazine-binding
MDNLNNQSLELETALMKSNGARSPELKRIQQVIDLYIDGVYNGKVASLQQAFHPKSSMFGWKAQDLYITPIQGLFDYCASTPIPSQTGEPTTFTITSMRITGNAATVEMAMDAYHGCNFVDYFQLVKVEDRWWIVSKTFHAEAQTS